jgi:hypothetical protein
MDEAKARAAALATIRPGGKLASGIAAGVGVAALLMIAIGIYWSREPAPFQVQENAEKRAAARGLPVVVGSTVTETLIGLAQTLLQKRGGYLSNDRLPPGVLLDNMPNWEFGVLVQVRDLSKALRETLSRSQSQSREDKDLAEAEPQFNFDNNSWLLPASESEYREGIKHLKHYSKRLSDRASPDAQFYARADNLRYYLGTVESRLGSLSQRLSACVGKSRVNTDLAGDRAARQSTPTSGEVDARTPWLEIDDVFFEARGSAWALIHILKAIEVDFADVLANKNAAVSLRQIIRELEGTQEPMWSPVILNGTGFGPLANHSLVMASYISRANAAMIDLRALLSQG